VSSVDQSRLLLKMPLVSSRYRESVKDPVSQLLPGQGQLLPDQSQLLPDQISCCLTKVSCCLGKVSCCLTKVSCCLTKVSCGLAKSAVAWIGVIAVVGDSCRIFLRMRLSHKGSADSLA
jgi:hypothetical protein